MGVLVVYYDDLDLDTIEGNLIITDTGFGSVTYFGSSDAEGATASFYSDDKTVVFVVDMDQMYLTTNASTASSQYLMVPNLGLGCQVDNQVLDSRSTLESLPQLSMDRYTFLGWAD